MENFENDNYNRDPNVKNDESSTQNESSAPQDTPADKNENSNEYFVHKSSGAIPPAANKGSRTEETAAADGIFADNRQKSARAMGIASMTLGILSLVLCCALWYVSFVIAVTGLILGIISQKKAGNGFAVAGIVTSSCGILLAVVCAMISYIFADIWGDLYPGNPGGSDRPGYDPNTDASIGEKLFSFVRALKFFFI